MKKQLKVFVLTMMILLICCVGQVSATNDNSSLTYDGDEIIVNDIDNENILSSVNNNQKSSEEFYEVHVGQNITEDGGNGSYENPFATLDLACIDVNGKGNVKINIFDGIYYVGSNLKFNTSNLLMQSINGGNVIIKPVNSNSYSQSLGFVSASSNFTFSNITFDAKDYGYVQNYTPISGNYSWFNVVKGKFMDGKFHNCTFLNFYRTYVLSYHSPFEFINCKFSKCDIILEKYYFNVKALFKYCILDKDPESHFFARMMTTSQIGMLKDCWFCQNTLPNYVVTLSGQMTYYPSGTWAIGKCLVSSYAVFSICEKYLGNNKYEIIGKLMRNGTNEVIKNIRPMVVNLSSNTGELAWTAILENGTFKVIYTSNSSNNKITAKLDEQIINLNFKNIGINASCNNIHPTENANITVNLPEAISGIVNVTINNKTHSLSINNEALVNVTINDLDEGNYTANIYFFDKVNHIHGLTSVNFIVSKVDDYQIYVIAPSEIKVGENATLKIIVPADANGNIDVFVGDKNYTKELTNSTINIDIPNLVFGNNNLIVKFSGNKKYREKTKNVIVTVDKINPLINILIPSDVKVGDEVNITFNLANDATGNLTVELNNIKQNLTIINGVSTLNLSFSEEGTYILILNYKGDDKYCSNENTTCIKVSKVQIVNIDKVLDINSFKDNSLYFAINLPLDATGNLTVSVGGKNYVETLVKGNAKIKILELCEGEHNVNIAYSGDDKYESFAKNISVSILETKLVGNNVVTFYTSGNIFKVRLTQGNMALSGKTIIFKVNSQKIFAKTDKNGFASFIINLNPSSKKYTITSLYNGIKTTNKITVKSIVIAKNLKLKKSAKTLKIKVYLKKINGKYLKGKKITLKFNGKIYNVKTNKKGLATFNIKKNILKKLKIGKKYTYKVSYLKDSVSKKITVKK
ncbi:Ig-like domain-containing protein [Methanobrevibacter sp. V74]|uniref:Ig-like domain-containing protein n=1 Tax=Methanobrevibacter sp. V74 TaxID=3064279 RepID=UPI0027345291|nr:Ig-like domain-containing protein [Methanobrevibacter sp. V74]